MRNEELGPTGIPFVRGGDINDGSINHQTVDHIRDEFRARVASKLTMPWDVAFITKGTVGRVGILRPHQPSVVFAPQVAYWRSLDLNRLDPRFVYYLLTGSEFQANLNAVKTHGAMAADYVSISQQHDFTLWLPSIIDQRVIASILGALDDKIELNRRMNETLEELARTIFKSWFVDFDPVRAKAEGKQPVGMDAETATLFPSWFVESELGSIPEGWSVSSLRDHLTLQRGTTYKSQLLGLPGPFLLGLASICRNGGFRRDKLVPYGGESPPKLILRPGDLYVALKDVTQAADLLGAVARVPPDVAAGRLTQDTLKLELQPSSFSPSYIEWLLRASDYREYCRARAIGTTNLSLSRDDFLAYRFVTPPAPVLKQFADLENSLTSRVHLNEQECQSLAEIRDLLLPKLISGELRIRDAEKLAEAAL